jgi:hypothetical protein
MSVEESVAVAILLDRMAVKAAAAVVVVVAVVAIAGAPNTILPRRCSICKERILGYFPLLFSGLRHRMDYDQSIDSVLLPLPFHVLVTIHGSPILVKLHVAQDLTLDVLATDLERAYHERLRPRQLASRVLASGGTDGDKPKLVQALTEFVAEQGHKGASSSETKVEPSDHGVRLVETFHLIHRHYFLTHISLQIFLSFNAPAHFTWSFDLEDIPDKSVLSRHLVVPLLGLASSFYSSIPSSTDLTDCLDSSARSARLKPERLPRAFFADQRTRISLQRWTQVQAGRSDLGPSVPRP